MFGLNLLIQICFSTFAIQAKELPSKGRPENQIGQFYLVRNTVSAPIYARSSDNKLSFTNNYVTIPEGSFINSNPAESEGLTNQGALIVKITTAKGEEWVGLPMESAEKKRTVIGRTILKDVQTPLLDGFTTYTDRKPYLQLLPNEGTSNKMGKYLDQWRKNDAQVFLDSDVINRIILSDSPSKLATICKDPFENKTCRGPTTEDPMKIIDTTVAYSYDNSTHLYQPKLFYKVATTFCPTNTIENCKDALVQKSGWVRADMVSTTRRPALISDILEDSTPVESNCRVRKNMSSLPDIINAVKQTEVNFNGDVLEKVGQCLKNEGSGEGKSYVEQGAALQSKYIKLINEQSSSTEIAKLNAQFNHDIKELGKTHFSNKTPFSLLTSFWVKQNPSVTSSGLTNSKLYAIDALARSLFGEIRNCGIRHPAYFEVVAKVILNRSEYTKEQGARPPYVKDASHVNFRSKPIHEIIPYVVSSDKQISSWNSGDPNLVDNLCPPQNKQDPEWKAWKSAVKIATQTIMNHEGFVAGTKDIVHKHYYSPNSMENGKLQPDWSVGKKKELVQLDSKTISDPKCLVLVNLDNK